VAKVGIYSRVSLDREAKSLSPGRQEAQCQALTAQRGWTVVKVYRDTDLSAFKTNVRRPAYEELLGDLARGVIDTVLVWKLDRLTRGGIRSLGPFLEALHAVGGTLISATEQLDTGTALGEGMLGLIASMAKQESENISVRVASAHAQAAREGRPHTGGSRAFGYEADGRTVIESEATVLREAAMRFLTGESIRHIAFDLNQRGIKTPTGRDFQSSSLSTMLRSPRLAGLRLHRGEVYRGDWTAIFSEDLHIALAEAFRTSRRRAARSQAVRHLLPGFVVCGLCDGAMKTMGFRMKNGRHFERYQCVKDPGRPNCGRVAVTKNSLDAFITDRVLAHLADGSMEALIDPADPVEITALRDLVDEDRQSLEMLTRARYFDRTLTEAEYVHARELLVERIETNEALLSRTHPQADPPDLPSDYEGLVGWWEEASNQDRRAAIRLVLKEVIISPAKRRGGNRFDRDRVEIRWR
jgi:site-specific DNA recombinase